MSGCNWPGCRSPAPPGAWGCSPHWRALPAKLRNRVWASKQGLLPGQRADEVARIVQAWASQRKEAPPA